ncbi:MAG: hypothetical protein RLZ26_2551 [Pseudomonadota bacterium]|jgi:hypothetical protein
MTGRRPQDHAQPETVGAATRAGAKVADAHAAAIDDLARRVISVLARRLSDHAHALDTVDHAQMENFVLRMNRSDPNTR